MEFGAEMSLEATKDVNVRRRQATQCLDTLLDSSIKSILKNPDFFDRFVENPFQNLPHVVISRIFELMNNTQWLEKWKTEPKEDNPRIIRLMNPNFEGFHFANPIFRKMHYKQIVVHLMHNCPNLKRVDVSLNPMEGNLSVSQVIMEIRGTNWQNLENLTLEANRCVCDQTLLWLKEDLPKLERLSLIDSEDMDIYKRLTMAGVEHMSQMKNLKLLGLFLGYDFNYSEPIWAQLFGRIPNLEKLRVQINDCVPRPSLFLQNYGKLFPNKPLHLDEYWFQNDWPSNVSVEVLHHHGGRTRSLNGINKIPKSVKVLILYSVPPSQIYKLMKTFGPSITSLQIWNSRQSPSLNVYQLLSECSQIVEVDIKHNGLISSKIPKIGQLHPKQFKNCNNFLVAGNNGGPNEVLKMVLLGSEQCSLTTELYVKRLSKVRAILEALRQGPCKFFSKLQEVEILCTDSESVVARDEFLELAYRLILNSPFLTDLEITFKVDKRDLKSTMAKCKNLEKFADAVDGLNCQTDVKCDGGCDVSDSEDD